LKDWRKIRLVCSRETTHSERISNKPYIMRINLFALLIGNFCLHFCGGCSGSNSSLSAIEKIGDKSTITDTNYLKVAYVKKILQIDKKSENSGTWDALFADKDFINIYEHSSYYVDSAAQFLSDEKFTLHQKTVCVYSMQTVKLEDCIRLFEQCADLFNDERIPELLLSRVIGPTFGKRKLIVENYDNVSVKRILESIRDRGNASQELRTMIEKVLSGEYWNRLKKFREEGGETN
jgi:hypothetical protein